ncbi:MAG: replicative helicase loader/inhibitor [Candidatus Gracilibacteria bacterium]|jgi:hypothetical protein|nr:replicative helicase loader/inhibitor [Candidatus Gracilibacteria bacterium]
MNKEKIQKYQEILKRNYPYFSEEESKKLIILLQDFLETWVEKNT